MPKFLYLLAFGWGTNRLQLMTSGQWSGGLFYTARRSIVPSLVDYSEYNLMQSGDQYKAPICANDLLLRMPCISGNPHYVLLVRGKL